MTINRDCMTRTIACTTSVATCAAIDHRLFTALAVIIPSGSPITSITWYGSDSETGTYVPVNDYAGAAAVQAVAAAQAYEASQSTAAFPWLKALVNSAGNITVLHKA